MDNIFTRTEMLIGKESIKKLKNSCIVIFGIGGVGSFSVEALARAGVESLVLIDSDNIDITNINRQIHANINTIGKSKVEVMKDRILSINPNCNVTIYKEFLAKENIEKFIPRNVDYVIDAIDTITSKIHLAKWCNDNNVKLISSMGTGNKLDPTQFKISDIYKTKVCPLARVMRRELKNIGVSSLKVLYSEEKPIDCKLTKEELEKLGKRHIPASISFVPSCAGLIIAGEVIKDIIDYNN